MNALVLLDTSIYLNVLDVEGWNQDRDKVLTDFEQRVKNGDSFLLPMATIWETGNHIADLPDGGRRRRFATKLIADVVTRQRSKQLRPHPKVKPATGAPHPCGAQPIRPLDGCASPRGGAALRLCKYSL